MTAFINVVAFLLSMIFGYDWRASLQRLEAVAVIVGK